jgi:hypothetical protein
MRTATRSVEDGSTSTSEVASTVWFDAIGDVEGGGAAESGGEGAEGVNGEDERADAGRGSSGEGVRRARTRWMADARRAMGVAGVAVPLGGVLLVLLPSESLGGVVT